MKRFFLLIALVAFMTVACETSDIISYKYESTTMMGKTTYTITQDSVVMSFKGRGEPKRIARETKSSEWNALAKAVEQIKLDDLEGLEAPTNLRSTDAAPFAKVHVDTKKGGTYSSQTFDGFHPHESLQPLLDEIKKITETFRGK